MHRPRRAALLGVAAVFIFGGGALAADETLDVEVDHPCIISVSEHDQHSYEPRSEGPVTQVRLTLDRSRRYDLKAEGQADTWHRWIATKDDVVAGPQPISLKVDTVPDWVRLGAVGGGLLVFIAGALVTRSRRGMHVAQQEKKVLEEELTEAQARAGLFPVSGALPSQVGPYKVIDRLGAGGMAVVYRVETPSGDHLALKLPLPQMWDDAEFKKRFGRELKIATSLRHVNLVRIIDINDGAGQFPYPFLVMEWVRGRPLNTCLRPLHPQPLDNVLAVGIQGLQALAHVHNSRIVHRDIKPGNIMITDDGQVKVMDFGIARTTDGTRLTGTEELLGTPLYMAPEQIDGGIIDGRTDIYAMGTVLYEMLTGRPPFTETNYLKLTSLKLRDDPPQASDINPSIGPELNKCVMTMLARQPEQRYWTAEDAATALRAFSSNVPRFRSDTDDDDNAPSTVVVHPNPHAGPG